MLCLPCFDLYLSFCNDPGTFYIVPSAHPPYLSSATLPPHRVQRLLYSELITVEKRIVVGLHTPNMRMLALNMTTVPRGCELYICGKHLEHLTIVASVPLSVTVESTRLRKLQLSLVQSVQLKLAGVSELRELVVQGPPPVKVHMRTYTTSLSDVQVWR